MKQFDYVEDKKGTRPKELLEQHWWDFTCTEIKTIEGNRYINDDCSVFTIPYWPTKKHFAVSCRSWDWTIILVVKDFEFDESFWRKKTKQIRNRNVFIASHALSELSSKVSRHRNCAQELLECTANPFPRVPAVLQVYRHFGVADSCEGQKFSDTCVRKLRTLASHNDVWDGHRQFGPNLCLQIAWSPMTLERRGAIWLKLAIFTKKLSHLLELI